MPKEKLTLSVDKEVVEKAKKLGINISEVTEKVLQGYTSAEKPNGSLYDAYKQLFESIRPLLVEFECSVKIADDTETVITTDSKGNSYEEEVPTDIYLSPDGSFYADQFDYSFINIEKIAGKFLSPQKILSNLVDALARNEETRKEKMNEILMAKRIIDAMSLTLLKGSDKQKNEKG